MYLLSHIPAIRLLLFLGGDSGLAPCFMRFSVRNRLSPATGSRSPNPSFCLVFLRFPGGNPSFRCDGLWPGLAGFYGWIDQARCRPLLELGVFSPLSPGSLIPHRIYRLKGHAQARARLLLGLGRMSPFARALLVPCPLRR